MLRPTDFCSKWLLKFDHTGKVCSRWFITDEGTTKLTAAMQNKRFDDIGTAEELVTAANSKLATLKTKLIENNENLNRFKKKQKK
ncbi:unnamed protein product [Adineta steineri]|uniref:Uncharacterized protein n=1 Tax=Adineta steineri TaxID=433720 RepID=A0A814M4N7_9BILA|nr:unnamed protein product [Adineta steineri]CAF1073915.1 unnamed protein product [Adineta steineri]CAF3996176.1 unnamed protein product [Adineta steineri]